MNFPSSFHPQLPWSYGYGHGHMPSPMFASPPLAVPIPPTSVSPCPFTLSKISGNISVCAGCRNKYSKQPTPPDDFCIRHQEWREYMYVPAGSQTPQSRFGNTYYHFNPHCVWMRCPGFIPTLLEIPPDISSLLDLSHRERLEKEFQIYLP